MPEALHGRLKDEAARAGQSLNRLCLAKLQAQPPVPAADVAAAPIPPEFLHRVRRRWQKELLGLVLVGSAARKDATGESDIDLLLVMRPEVLIRRALYHCWDEFHRMHPVRGCDRISPQFVHLPDSVMRAGGLWYETAIEGVILWEDGGQVSQFLRLVRSAMAHGRIRRRILHGSPYWIKEPEEADAQ